MQKKIFAIILTGMIFCLTGIAFAGNSTTQTVTFQVNAINEITVSGNPGALIVSTATAGSEPDQVSDSSTTYNITTNGSNKKITGQLDSAMPSDTTLTVSLVAPSGGTSAGDVALSATAANLVTDINKKKGSSLGITYKFSATVDAGIISSTSRTATLTILDGP